MITIYYKKKFLTIGQVWYLENQSEWKEIEKGDLLFFHGIDKKMQLEGSMKKHAVISEFHTLVTDLHTPEEELLADINKTERYQIRKSEKDGGRLCYFSGNELARNEKVISQLAKMYEEMYREKGTPQSFNHVQFKEYLKCNCITVSCIYQEETPLVFHSYVTDEKQARLLHSVSEFRNPDVEANVIGRANKRLHFEDLLHFKDRKMAVYDWGGISDFENPNGIDTFKMKFGGKPLTYYNIICGKTLLGKIGVFVMKILGKHA